MTATFPGAATTVPSVPTSELVRSRHHVLVRNFLTEIKRSALSKSQSDGWPGAICRYEHNPLMLLGTVAGGTLRLTTDQTGLDYEVDMPERPVWSKSSSAGSTAKRLVRVAIWPWLHASMPGTSVPPASSARVAVRRHLQGRCLSRVMASSRSERLMFRCSFRDRDFPIL